ncbi:alpha/beta hydrolase [Microbacterium azadirachtae]|uniref:Lipase 2 n=1 Tax=Microbacterium azadirachtae TaxID=582680 RepID=A0A0F0KUL5_9MICO|nr:alpha/beta hydrolase [Microbacterium azadirachtae]KJL24607.1 Lipase 2 [Microbacterium azadirachtae]UXW85882.1 alpha/beta hydrolase [Microbacterium azadirachtae]
MTLKTPLRLPTDWEPACCDSPSEINYTTEDGFRRYRDVEYAIVDGYRPLLLDLMIPADANKPAPLIIFIHGGAWLAGSKNFRSRDVDDRRPLFARLFEEGYAVATIQYRLSAEATFPAQVHDVKAATRWLRNAAPALGLDADRIGSVGESAGGYLSLFLGSNTSDPVLEGEVGMTGLSSSIAASVAWYPATRLDTLQEETLPGSPFPDHGAATSPSSLLIGVAVSEQPELARRASPITHINQATAPTLLIHGTLDQLVPHQQSIAYHEALQAEGVPSELHLIEGADHGFFGGDVDAIVDLTVAFLNARLCRGRARGTEEVHV